MYGIKLVKMLITRSMQAISVVWITWIVSVRQDRFNEGIWSLEEGGWKTLTGTVQLPTSGDQIMQPICFASTLKPGVEKKYVPGHNNSLLVSSHMRDPSKTGSSSENISSFASRSMRQHNIVRYSLQKIMKSKILRTQRQRKSLSPRALPLNCSTTPLLKPFYNIL